MGNIDHLPAVGIDIIVYLSRKNSTAYSFAVLQNIFSKYSIFVLFNIQLSKTRPNPMYPYKTSLKVSE